MIIRTMIMSILLVNSFAKACNPDSVKGRIASISNTIYEAVKRGSRINANVEDIFSAGVCTEIDQICKSINPSSKINMYETKRSLLERYNKLPRELFIYITKRSFINMYIKKSELVDTEEKAIAAILTEQSVLIKAKATKREFDEKSAKAKANREELFKELDAKEKLTRQAVTLALTTEAAVLAHRAAYINRLGAKMLMNHDQGIDEEMSNLK